MFSETDEKNKVEGNSPAEKIFVGDLQEKQQFQSYFLVKDKNVAMGKNGKSYISLFLSDRTGSVDARIWDNVEPLSNQFDSGDIIWVKGTVQVFQNRKQVVIHKLERVDASEIKMSDFIGSASRAPEEMYSQLKAIGESISDPHIKQLTLDVLADAEVRERLLTAPAAKTIHHAYRSGLLEHIVSICGLMRALHGHYEAQGISMRLDLLLFGAIFHDIGKIWELEMDHSISYTDKGKLLGHMILAVELVEKKTARIMGFPEALKDRLKHIILSHHGKIEYGSPKTPVFLEAVVVAAIDDLDSKINQIGHFVRNERSNSGDKWSRYHQMFERYFLLDV